MLKLEGACGRVSRVGRKLDVRVYGCCCRILVLMLAQEGTKGSRQVPSQLIGSRVSLAEFNPVPSVHLLRWMFSVGGSASTCYGLGGWWRDGGRYLNSTVPLSAGHFA